MDTIDYYNRHAREYYENTVDLDMGKIMTHFIDLLPEDAAVLDLGCGSGRDSLFMIENGFDVTALDASKELCELAQIHIGQDVLNMKIQDIDFQDVFDGVWACSSLLHIPMKEIDDVLDKIIISLKKDGILYVSVPYGEFSGKKEGRFIQEYTIKSLKYLLEKHKELEIINIFETEDIRLERKNKIWISVLARKITKKREC